MRELMTELRQWKRESEQRMGELSTRGSAIAYADARTPTQQPPPAAASSSGLAGSRARGVTPRAYPPGAIALATCASSTPEAERMASAGQRSEAGAPGSNRRARMMRNDISLRANDDGDDRGGYGNGYGRHGQTSPSRARRVGGNALSLAAEARALAAVPTSSSSLSSSSAAAGGAPRGERSLRELQRELESLKSSLSVYLGSGLT